MFAWLILTAAISMPASASGQAWNENLPASVVACFRYNEETYADSEPMLRAGKTNCADDENRRRALILDATYRALRDSLPLERRERLVALQAAWHKASENRCYAESDGQPYETSGVALYLCRMHAANERIAWLRAPGRADSLDSQR